MFDFFVASRFLKRSRLKFLKLITLVAVAGITLGIATVIGVLSVNNGFIELFQKKIVSIYPHIIVYKKNGLFYDYRDTVKELKKIKGVTNVTWTTLDEIMMAYKNRSMGVMVKGVNFDDYNRFVKKFIIKGSFSAIKENLTVLKEKKGGFKVKGAKNGGYYLVFVDRNGVKVMEGDPAPPEFNTCRVYNATSSPLVLKTEEGSYSIHPQSAVEIKKGKFRLKFSDKSSEKYECKGNEKLVIFDHDKIYEEDVLKPVLTKATFNVFNFLKKGININGRKVPEQAVNFSFQETAEYASCVVGSEVFKKLRLKIGDKVLLSSPLRGIDSKEPAPIGMAPTAQYFVVAGVIKTDFYEFDKRIVLTSYKAMVRFFNQGDNPRWLEVRVYNPFLIDTYFEKIYETLNYYPMDNLLDFFIDKTEKIKKVLSGELSFYPVYPQNSTMNILNNAITTLHILKFESYSFGLKEDFKILTWEEINKNPLTTLKLQKVVFTLFFLIIVIIASFSIISTQILLINNKLPDIAILKSMGATKRQISNIFTIYGGVFVLSGIIFGIILSFVILYILKSVKFHIDPEVYFIPYLPVSIKPLDISLIALVSTLFSFIIVRIGATVAALKKPIESLRIKR